MPKKRNYGAEYKNYQGKPEQKKNRAERNAARAKMVAAGKARKGDGKDVAHISGSTKNNSMSNLRMETKKQNRSYPRTKNAKKKNKKD
jgi:hypothetical protein